MSELVLKGAQGCLLGVALGDALGLPWEMQTRKQIYATIGGPVTDFSGTVRTSDDTQLTLAVARSLVECGEFDLISQARHHVDELLRTTHGWGGATRNAVEALEQWFAKGDMVTFPEPKVIPGKGTGNGVAMKIAPLAIFHAVRTLHGQPISHSRSYLAEHVRMLGHMTHADDRASEAAYVVAQAMADLLLLPRHLKETDQSRREWFARSLLGSSLWWELYATVDPDRLSSRIARTVRDAIEKVDANVIRLQCGTSCFALESTPFSLATFLRHPTDFRSGVLEAVNAGGDTDSNASIVGALIGANVGIDGIPAEWLERLPQRDEILQLADALMQSR